MMRGGLAHLRHRLLRGLRPVDLVRRQRKRRSRLGNADATARAEERRAGERAGPLLIADLESEIAVDPEAQYRGDAVLLVTRELRQHVFPRVRVRAVLSAGDEPHMAMRVDQPG